MDSRKLTDKQEVFCQEYLIDLNGTKALIRAGYSEKGAKSSASKLLAKGNVKKRINELKAGRTERTKIDSDWVLNRLADEAEADIADLYDIRGALKPIHQWPKIWRTGLVVGLKVKQEFEYIEGEKVPDGVTTEVKLSEKIKRIELIGKHSKVNAFGDDGKDDGADLATAIEKLADKLPGA